MKLYHITFVNRLPHIGVRGLRPGEAASIGGEEFDPHREGAIFLTSEKGIPFWYETASEWAIDFADDPLADGFVPVVLAVELQLETCTKDVAGTGDAGHRAYRCETVVDPDYIRVFSAGETPLAPGQWLPVTGLADLDEAQVCYQVGCGMGVEDGEILHPLENPLVPTGRDFIRKIKTRLLR